MPIRGQLIHVADRDYAGPRGMARKIVTRRTARGTQRRARLEQVTRYLGTPYWIAAGLIMAIVLEQAEKSAPVVGEERILLSDIRWEFYLTFCEEIGERPIRLSYSEGLLEIMITHSPHEFYKTMLAKLIEMVILERNLPVRSGGAMTFQRHDLEKGFEPDECWWIEHEAAVRGKREFDFQQDPPPDLAIEVEMSRSLVNRIGIFAAMGVEELWRYNGSRLRFCVLQDDGRYQEQETSLAFPFLRPGDLDPTCRSRTTPTRPRVSGVFATGSASGSADQRKAKRTEIMNPGWYRTATLFSRSGRPPRS